MDLLNRMMETTESGSGAATAEAIVLALLMAFVLGQLLAWAYCWTHNGLSYSRSFTQSLIPLTMIVALVMIVIGNNIVTAFGLIGALALIRFRNVLKDTRDTVFIFAALVQGMAVGTQRYATAALGTAALLAVVVYLHLTDFGSRGHFDGYLRFSMNVGEGMAAAVGRVLRSHCRAMRQVASQRNGQDDAARCTWQVRLRNIDGGGELIGDLERIEGVHDVSLVLQEEIMEV